MVDRFERFSLAISEIYRCWHKIAGDEMEKYGLKGPHCIYLITMARYPEGLTSVQLCEYCGKDKSDVSRMTGMMERMGLVVRESVHQNLYRSVFRLTEQGRQAAAFVKQRANMAVALAGKDMDDGKRAIFYECLESVAENIRSISQEGLPEGKGEA